MRNSHDQLFPAALPAALDEWRTPSHPEFTEQGRHGWRLFNAVTDAIKGRCLDELPRPPCG